MSALKTDLQDQTLRPDLRQSLTRSHINPATLSPFQRILLTTDGTVTDILEAYLFEQIQVVKLAEALHPTPQAIPELELVAGTEVIDRQILLKGKISQRHFIYAESIIVPSRLDEHFRHELLKTRTPIGKIWLDQKVETFKEIIISGREPAQHLAAHFDITPEDVLLFRTYRVISNRQATMLITEKFPERYFLPDF